MIQINRYKVPSESRLGTTVNLEKQQAQKLKYNTVIRNDTRADNTLINISDTKVFVFAWQQHHFISKIGSGPMYNVDLKII